MCTEWTRLVLDFGEENIQIPAAFFSRDLILEGKNGENSCFGEESNGINLMFKSLSVWGEISNLVGEISPPKGPEESTGSQSASE